MSCYRKPVLAFPWAFVFPLQRGGTCAVRTWNCSFCATWAPHMDPVRFLSHHVLLQEPPRYLATPRGASQSARPLGEGVLDSLTVRPVHRRRSLSWGRASRRGLETFRLQAYMLAKIGSKTYPKCFFDDFWKHLQQFCNF